MRIPGSNLLNTALKVIASEPVWLFEYNGTTTNDIGIKSTSYKKKQKVLASVQSVPREKFSQMGLDFKKVYVNVFASKEIEGIKRGTDADQIEWKSQRWEAVQEGGWYPIDGWGGVLFVRVGP